MRNIHYTFLFLFIFSFLGSCKSQSQPEWPDISYQNKPWTRWWWMGSAVNKRDLAANLEQLKNANIGGVEITPIYGVAGYEDQFIDYLSPEWMEMLEFTLQKSDSLNLGVDMATGSGWPFGGPWVGADNASKNVHLKTYQLTGGQRLDEKIAYMQEPLLSAVGNHLDKSDVGSLSIDDIKEPIATNDHLQAMALAQVRFKEPLPLQTLMAYSNDGQTLNLTDRVDKGGSLNWQAPSGDWKLYAVFQGLHGKMVERAAPGGEGHVVDYFSDKAIADYLDRFNRAFDGYDISSLRAFFNDSYEVDDAQGEAAWTPQMFAEFEQRRGYDLRKHLPALFGKATDEMNSRVISDFRETISGLLLNKFTKHWRAWADSNDAIIRNQAHGSPANILDLYAASSIPETEGTDILRAKMASSAAHVTGKPLVSSESATWLNEHFRSSLSDVKTAVDRFFISGVNHIFYHGSAYTPQDAKWPGWLFYAAVHFQPDNPFWDHFGAFNQYVTRVQSFLQKGKPDNDVLLYYPIYDQWAQPGHALLEHFDGGIDRSFAGTAFKNAADMMRDQGYTFDFISDRQLHNIEIGRSEIKTKGGKYKTLVIPSVQYMPLETLQQVVAMARGGNTIIMYKGTPQDVPGLGNVNKRRDTFHKLLNQLDFSDSRDIHVAKVGDGRVILGNQLDLLLSTTKVRREKMIDCGLRFARRATKDGDGGMYFITNWGDAAVDGWVSITRKAASAALYKPMNKETGYAKVKPKESGGSQVYLQLQPGESCILKTYASDEHKSTYPYVKKKGDAIPLEGSWSVHFVKGGPGLPADIQTDSLQSWTKFKGASYKNFSGTARYSTSFSVPDTSISRWLLKLGQVHESATVSVNGHKLGTEIGPVYQVLIPGSIIRNENTLTIDVSNSMANRIAYMDQNNITWKRFYNVDFPAHDRKNVNKQGLFDASGWLPEDSGLMGPVTLTPVDKMK